MYWWYQKLKLMKLFHLENSILKDFSSPYSLDRNCYGGGILVYVREDFPSKLIEMNSSVESISIELNLRKKKWLVYGSYNANNCNICDHLRSFGKSLDTLQIMITCFLWGTLTQKKLTFILRISAIFINWKTW